MSSIIDALKKSDAKRPNKNHGLKIRMDLKNHADKKKPWKFYTVVLVLALILVAVYFQKPDFLWQSMGSAKQPTVTVTNTPDKPTPSKQINKLDKPAPEQVQSVIKTQATVITNDDNPTDKSANSQAQRTQAVIIKSTDGTATHNNEEDSHGPSKQADNQIKQQIDEQLAATPMKNKQAINQPTESKQNQPPTPNLPQLFELPYNIRKDLPKINLSVHVYDTVAENRMAILNGVPFHVGDVFVDGVTIQDITQSGVVLRIQNRDFIVLK